MIQKNAISKDIYPLSFLLCGSTWHGPSLSLTIEEPITTVKVYNSLDKVLFKLSPPNENFRRHPPASVPVRAA